MWAGCALLAFSAMTARTRSPGRPADRRRAPAPRDEPEYDDEDTAVDRLGWTSTPTRLRIALGLAVLGAALAFVGVEMGLVEDEPARGFASAPLLLPLAFAPAILAIIFVLFGRAPVAAGVLTGAALLAPGLALVDAQFLRDALQASRPELMVPTSLAHLTPATGSWLLLAGHVAAAAAGLLAAGRAGAAEDTDYHAALDRNVISVAARGRAMGCALACVTLSVAGLLLPPFRSDNAFVVAHDLVASPILVRIGGILLALTLLLGGVLAAGAPRPALARGMVLGLLVAFAWLTLPQIVAALSVDWLHVDRGGPLLALLPLALLALVLFAVPGLSRTDRAELAEGELPPDLQLESSPAHLVTGVLGVLAGVAALGGAFGTQLVIEGGLDQPESYANRQLVPAGVLIIVLGAALFTRWAGTVRPAFVVALASVPLVGLAALDAAFTGTAVSGPAVVVTAHVGAGVWFTGVALVLAAVAAVAAAVAGGAERDDVDLTERRLHIRIVVPLVAVVLLAVGAFGLPMITAPDFVAPGIWTEFRLGSWGLLVALAVVLVAAVIASMARPARAAALLLGAATVVGIHLLELPMTGDRAAGATAGAGTWLSLACAVALIVSAVVAITTKPVAASK